MANQLKTKFYQNDSVKSEKILLENNTALRAKDSGGVTQDILKVDATDKIIVYRSSGAEELAYQSDIAAVSGDFVLDAGDTMSGSLVIDGSTAAVPAPADLQIKDHLDNTKTATFSPSSWSSTEDLSVSGTVSLSLDAGGGTAEITMTGSEINLDAATIDVNGDMIIATNKIALDAGSGYELRFDNIVPNHGTYLSSGESIFLAPGGSGFVYASSVKAQSTNLYNVTKVTSNTDNAGVVGGSISLLNNSVIIDANLSSGTIDMNSKVDMNGNALDGLIAPVSNGQPLIYDQVGAANGIAPLNASSKIDSLYLPSYVDDVEEYANLAAIQAISSPESGKIYVALDTNKTYRWSGSAFIEISPSEVNSVNTKTGIVTLDTDDIGEGAVNFYYTEARFDASLLTKDTDDLAEGSTNLYFTETRAKTAAVSDTAYGSGWNGVIDVAPSKNAVYDEMQLAKGRLDALEAIEWAAPYKKTLDGTDITNQYIDLPHLAVETNGMSVAVDRLQLHQGGSEDYTLSTVGGVTRITFLNDLVSPGNQALQSGDNIFVRYQRSV